MTNSIEKEEDKINTEREEKESKPIYYRFMVLIILIFTIMSAGTYGFISDQLFYRSDDIETYLESQDFVYRLTRLTTYLKLSKFESNDRFEPAYEFMENIKYYITDGEGTIKSNIPEVTDDKFKKEIDKSRFYLNLSMDEKGDPKIESSLGNKLHKETIMDRLKLRNKDKIRYANFNITYLVPTEINNPNDVFMYYMKSHYIYKRIILLSVIGIVSIIILSIMALGTSYYLQREKTICRLFNKMFLEFKFLLWIGFGTIVCCTGALMGTTYRPNRMYSLIDIIYDGGEYFHFALVPLLFLLYLLIYLSIVHMKHIYHTGFKEGFIKNSILGRLCCYIIKKFLCIIRNLKKLFQEIFKVKKTNDSQSDLIVTLVGNFIILFIIASTEGLGIVIAFLYTIVLYVYLLKFSGRIRALNNATNKLVEGDFDINIDEKMGILSDIAINLNNIKDGFKVAIDKETKSQQMKTELISNVSHDLKTPLTSIITYVDLLKSEDLVDETQREYIDILDRKSKRLKVLIEDLFEASKASSGNIDMDLEDVDVIALCRQTIGELEEKINESTLTIKMNAPKNKVICQLDGRRTYRIFENIMSNILKYAMENSRVYIDVLEDEKEISFVFKNMSSYEMNFNESEITERFTRGDKSRNTEGSGLGLAIAKNLIELQRGNLKIVVDGDLFKSIVTFPKAEK